MIPLIDTHVHLGGSVPTKFVWEIINSNIDKYRYLGETYEDVQKSMTFTTGESYGFHRFLNKFKILDEIKWTEDLIDSKIKLICDNFNNQGVHGAWLDFSINKYMNIGWHRHEAIKFIRDRFTAHQKQCNIHLLLSVKYESTYTSFKQTLELLDKVHDCVLGIDFVGDEIFYTDKVSHLTENWRKSGKLVRAHVGEYGPADNILTAILNLKVTNIAHGIKIVNDPNIIRAALDNDIQFDLGITSNYLTGVVSGEHPIRDMISKGLKITIGTDDPVVCDTNLTKEFDLVSNMLSANQVELIRKTAFDSFNSWCKA